MLADINNPINFDKKNALIQLELGSKLSGIGESQCQFFYCLLLGIQKGPHSPML